MIKYMVMIGNYLETVWFELEIIFLFQQSEYRVNYSSVERESAFSTLVDCVDDLLMLKNCTVEGEIIILSLLPSSFPIYYVISRDEILDIICEEIAVNYSLSLGTPPWRCAP